MKSDISGFPEFLPREQIAFDAIVDSIKKHFESYGFIPMDTHAVEHVDTLLAKGNDKEIYGLYRLADSNSAKKDLGLRFDLTVPLARYMASNFGNITFPHKRYQIAPVWRGERPQFGRYRQFYQCDIDIVGDGELSIAYDAEVIIVIIEVLRSIDIPKFTTRINNRKILSGFLCTITEESKVPEIIKIIDKFDEIPKEDSIASLEKCGITKASLEKLLSFLELDKKTSNAEILSCLKRFNFGSQFKNGVAELEETISLLEKCNIDDDLVKISMKLARGLAYYTGNVFETSFDNIEGIGSIAAGGRYDSLALMISNKKIPGVGAGIGLSRLVAKLIEISNFKCNKSSTAHLLVTVQNCDFIGSYMNLAHKFRRLGINTETYLHSKSLASQLSYANKKGINYVLIANEVELLENKAILRNLITKEQNVIRTEYIGKEVLDFIKW
jgi:histidyl-tRNA synthetase